VDARLAELLPTVLPGHDALARAVRDSAMGPGKLLRPTMTILVSHGLGGSVTSAIDAGCAV
jgi:geranylgeranyl pyrophosphate synthase